MKKDSCTDTPGARPLSRRDVLGMLGAAATAPLVGSVQASSDLPAPVRRAPAAMARPSCVVRPQQTEGPYFVDAQLLRSDIRSDPSDGAIKDGVPLRLEFRVARVDENTCAPLPDAVVDVWQCDAQGTYSAVRDRRSDTREQTFLRGHQVTDENGVARFVTIFPGWYRGRTVHIHFKIRTDPAASRGYEFTSQLYFEEDVTDQVAATASYAVNTMRRVKNSTDGIYRRGGDQLMLTLTPDEEVGFAGVFEIGLDMS